MFEWRTRGTKGSRKVEKAGKQAYGKGIKNAGKDAKAKINDEGNVVEVGILGCEHKCCISIAQNTSPIIPVMINLRSSGELLIFSMHSFN